MAEEATPNQSPSDQSPDDLLTVGQAAARLGVTKSRVHRLVKDGRLPAVKRSSPLGDYWEIRATDLDLVRGLKNGRPRKIKQEDQSSSPR